MSEHLGTSDRTSSAARDTGQTRGEGTSVKAELDRRSAITAPPAIIAHDSERRQPGSSNRPVRLFWPCRGAAEIRAGLPWARIVHLLGMLKAVRYAAESRSICSAHENRRRTDIFAGKAWNSNTEAAAGGYRNGRDPRPGIDTRPESLLRKSLLLLMDSRRVSRDREPRLHLGLAEAVSILCVYCTQSQSHPAGPGKSPTSTENPPLT
jgi:hypothetical protein